MYLRNSSVTEALKGLKELGYQAEVAIPSATNKLRCKEMSDTLFLQNIPEVITENKVCRSKNFLFESYDFIRRANSRVWSRSFSAS